MGRALRGLGVSKKEVAVHPLADFNFEARRVRVSVDERGEPWFVAAEVCAALDIADSPNALGRLGDDEKGVGTTDTPGGIQRVATVNEPGVYLLVFTSQAAGRSASNAGSRTRCSQPSAGRGPTRFRPPLLHSRAWHPPHRSRTRSWHTWTWPGRSPPSSRASSRSW
ncbi:Bro-N domain-containing protein [Myxococcus sp. AM001]|nr:Bro-N domain-containing protein [Myxococcus sp. AM001]